MSGFPRRAVPSTNGHRRRKARSVDCLDTVQDVTIRLGDGTLADFDVADEMHVPSDPAELLSEARRAPAQLAFWSAQAERVMHALRIAERELAEVEGHEYLITREWYDKYTEAPMVTEAMVRSRVDRAPAVKKERIRVEGLRYQWSLLRSLVDASNHRCHLLRKLATSDAQAKRD